MRHVRTTLVAVSIASLLGACGSSATATKPTPTTKPTTTTKPTAASTAATVDLGTTSLGKVLVDAAGRTLYLYKQDSPGRTSACQSNCAAAWPPEETSGSAKSGPGVDTSKLGIITRTDGTKQVTYSGWPLYRHAADVKPGDVTGEKVSSQWYAISVAGTAVGG
jgi:predicted lipoprotein with Yx(FWY)xxD motif